MKKERKQVMKVSLNISVYLFKEGDNVIAYFPIFVDKDKYGQTRDELYFKMRERNVLGRRYFYPLISTFSTYRGLESANPDNLPNAHKMAEQVICLPMHHLLTDSDIARVLDCIVK